MYAAKGVVSLLGDEAESVGMATSVGGEGDCDRLVVGGMGIAESDKEAKAIVR